MFRPSIQSTSGGKPASTPGVTSTSPNKRESSTNNNATTNDNNASSTIREIRSRTVGGTSSAGSAARQLLANRRQAMSMERLNGSSMSSVTTSASMNNMHNFSDKGEKSSPMNGSSNSISGSTASSPSRGSSASSNGGLNRTASRVSRFRSAKAVFERLSSVNSAAASKPDRLSATQAGGLTTERPKGTVASRYAAAAAARGAAGQQSLSGSSVSSSPRSRMGGSKSPLRSHPMEQQQSSKSQASSNSGSQANNKPVAPNSPKQDPALRSHQPKPQPRVITTATRRTPIMTASQTATAAGRQATDQQSAASKGAARGTPTRSTASMTSANSTPRTGTANINQGGAQPKPPPKDLIDKIVLEIVRDAKNEHDANCTIQDLSNCDTSGIPETLDFDKCFQDVEMMTEEEARKLLSRKSESPSSASSHRLASPSGEQTMSEVGPTQDEVDQTHGEDVPQGQREPGEDSSLHQLQFLNCLPSKTLVHQRGTSPSMTTTATTTANCGDQSSDSLAPPLPGQQGSGAKSKVRFSDEPVTVYDTHAASDYDRRNDDIDPVAASAEYEIEKSREREGIRDDQDDDEDGLDRVVGDRQKGAVVAVIKSFNQQLSSMKTCEDYQAGSHTPQSVAAAAHGGDHRDSSDNRKQRAASDKADYDDVDDDDQTSSRKDYIESLEREVSIKRILEQNLRDLQSQYYETVKQLDSYKGDAETKISKLEEDLTELGDRYESAQSELADAREQSNQYEKQLNDIKESSQLLEKKYHRAKRIIKDMQSREESFTRREQLYQQKLDEIEYELGVLIDTIDRTIYEDGLRYFSMNLSDGNSCSRQHQMRLDVLGLIKQMMDNFNNSKKTQSAQIKQRIVTMLEQQLANLLANSNGCTSITAGPVVPIPPVVPSSASKQTPTVTTSTNKPHPSINSNNNNNNNEDDTNKHNQNYSYASHRLSQPNMPHPIGVGGQPTKIFHGLNTMPIVATLNEPSPPQSVNSYPSTNSLNSLNNNNNNNANNNNNGQQVVNNTASSLVSSKLKDHQLASQGDCDAAAASQTTTTSLSDEVFQPPPTDAQVPYQTNEWHDKPVSEWTTTQVSTWLLALGLDQYISKFEDRNVNGQSLINLDSTVLKGLGVLNSNDRNLLKKKIRELRVEMEKERKIIEKKLKENLKDKSKVQTPNQNKQSWKKSLLS